MVAAAALALVGLFNMGGSWLFGRPRRPLPQEVPPQLPLLRPGPRHQRLPGRARHHRHRPGLRLRHRLSVAGDGAPHQRHGGPDLRTGPALVSLRDRLLQPPGRRLPRGLAGGRIYDATGSYDAVWVGAVVLGVAAAVVHPADQGHGSGGRCRNLPREPKPVVHRCPAPWGPPFAHVPRLGFRERRRASRVRASEAPRRMLPEGARSCRDIQESFTRRDSMSRPGRHSGYLLLNVALLGVCGFQRGGSRHRSTHRRPTFCRPRVPEMIGPWRPGPPTVEGTTRAARKARRVCSRSLLLTSTWLQYVDIGGLAGRQVRNFVSGTRVVSHGRGSRRVGMGISSRSAVICRSWPVEGDRWSPRRTCSQSSSWYLARADELVSPSGGS